MRMDIMERTFEFIFLLTNKLPNKKTPVRWTAGRTLLFSTLFYVAASGGK